MYKSVFAAAVLSIAMVGGAQAQWAYQGEADAFSDVVLHLAVGAGDGAGYALGFRCSEEEDLTVLFMTPERIESSEATLMSAVGPTLMVRIDDNEIVELKSEVLSLDGKLTVMNDSADVLALSEQAVGASKRIAVTIEMMGERFHTTNISTRGSTSSIRKVLEGCALSSD